jgi:hypothetical protein
VINRELAANAAAHNVLNRIVRQQLEILAGEATSYIADPETMPHERGSIDTFDDMRNSADTAVELLNRLQNAMLGEDPEKILADLRLNLAEIFFPCSLGPDVEQLLGVTWDEANDRQTCDRCGSPIEEAFTFPAIPSDPAYRENDPRGSYCEGCYLDLAAVLEGREPEARDDSTD